MTVLHPTESFEGTRIDDIVPPEDSFLDEKRGADVVAEVLKEVVGEEDNE